MCEVRKRLRTWIEGVILASAVTGRVLLDATTYLIKGVTGELDDVKGVEDAGCVLGAGQAMAFLLSPPWRGPESRSVYRSESLRHALLASSCTRCQTFLGPGPLKRAVG